MIFSVSYYIIKTMRYARKTKVFACFSIYNNNKKQ